MSKFNILAVILAIVLIGPAAAGAKRRWRWRWRWPRRWWWSVAAATSAGRRRSYRWRWRSLRRWWRSLRWRRPFRRRRRRPLRGSTFRRCAPGRRRPFRWRAFRRKAYRQAGDIAFRSADRVFAATARSRPTATLAAPAVERRCRKIATPRPAEMGIRRFRGNRNASVRSRAVQRALNSRAVAGALHNRAALRNPNMRAQIAATAATAGWQHGRGRNGWWRHRHGGYGWVGPLFWPFAYDDWYDYTMWGYGDDPSFWDYGYNDIYAGIFAPYGYDDLAGYLPPSGSGSRAGIARPDRGCNFRPVGANVRRGQSRDRRPADRSDPAGNSAQRRAACGAR